MLFQKRVDRAMRYQKEQNEAAELKRLPQGRRAANGRPYSLKLFFG